jgi:hypothetical protein
MAIVAAFQATPCTGSYTVGLQGVGIARYEHWGATPPAPGMTIRTTLGWARVVEVIADACATADGELTAIPAPPPPAVRPVCPEY